MLVYGQTRGGVTQLTAGRLHHIQTVWVKADEIVAPARSSAFYCGVERMNQAVFAFRHYEDASLRYTGIDSHEGLSRHGLFNTVVATEN